MTYQEAIRVALAQEMGRDASVFVYGIGVADHKGSFSTTLGLAKRFGAQRCFDTPLCEDALTGFGVGAAMAGMRPVLVHLRADFALLGLNQLWNVAAGLEGPCPLTVRVIVGRGWGQGSQHSKSMHGAFAHVPGVRVWCPTTPEDVARATVAAIRGDRPTVIVEHRWLYWQEGDVALPVEPETPKCRTVSGGRWDAKVTIASIGWTTVEATQAAFILGRTHGVPVQVVDVPCLDDLSEVVGSALATGRLIVVDHDWPDCGWGAEIAAVVGESCGRRGGVQVHRVGFAPWHCPTARHLENQFNPNAGTVVRAAEALLGLMPCDLSGEEFYSHERHFRGPF